MSETKIAEDSVQATVTAPGEHPVRCAATLSGSGGHIHRCHHSARIPAEVVGLLVHRCISTVCGGFEWTEPMRSNYEAVSA